MFEVSIDDWAWSICGCRARRMVGLLVNDWVLSISRSVDARRVTMRGTLDVHAATAASWLSEYMWNPSNERLSFTDIVLCGERWL